VEAIVYMSSTIRFDQTDELFGCEDSDEALERAAGAGKVIAVAAYTLLYCTSQDCSMVS
jgi:hypothetical protein